MLNSRHFIAGLALAFCAFAGHAATFTVTNNLDSSAGSLRQAITDANDNPASNNISFNLPGNGAQVIAPYSALPVITSQVTIDATTQPGYAGTPLIVLSGNNSGYIDGLTISAPGCVIKGLAIGNFGANTPHSGIVLLSANNTITSCYLGVSETGTATRFNHYAGILISNAAGNVIGGTTTADRNLIGGNITGVFITGANASNNAVLGNWFSLSADGSTTLENITDIIVSNAADNTIGGALPAARNVLDGSTDDLIVNGGSANNTILGNYLNLLPNGSATANPSGLTGILVQNATGTVIGGAATGSGNVISGCNIGVKISGATTSGTVVEGNFLGTDPAGLKTDYNYSSISITGSSGNWIGGSTPGAGNVITGKGIGAVSLSEGADNNTVQGNFIGTDASGDKSLALNNGSQTIGILISSVNIPTVNNLIGGTLPAERNVISGNSGDGVQLNGAMVSNNVIEGDFIGDGADDSTPLGNKANGVTVYGADNNTISGNTIAHNASQGQAGVYLYFGTGNTISGNSIFDNLASGVMLLGADVVSQNSIYGNNGLGISLDGSPDETVNYSGQTHHFPVINLATSSSTSTRISGLLPDDAPNTSFTIEFFSSPFPNPSGFGEGQNYLGSTTVDTDANGNAAFDLACSSPTVPGWVVSATSTGPAPFLETSPFAKSFVVAPDPCGDITFRYADEFAIHEETTMTYLQGEGVDDTFTNLIVPTGGTPPYKLSYSSQLPSQFTLTNHFDLYFQLEGATQSTGTFTFTVTAIDANGLCSGSKTYTLTITAFPTLIVESVGPGGLTLAFPIAADDYALESSSTVGPGAHWIPVTIPRTREGNLESVLVSPDGTTFYRLSK